MIALIEDYNSHSANMESWFNQIYNVGYIPRYDNIDYVGIEEEAIWDAINNGEQLLFGAWTDTYYRSTELGLNPADNILIVAPNGSNSFIEMNRNSEGLDYHVISVGSVYNDFNPNIVSTKDDGCVDTNENIYTSYGNKVEFNEPTQAYSWSGCHHQQSPATAIVAAKLAKIQNLSGETWWYKIRLAARQTASKARALNPYEGFGVIDVNEAVDLLVNPKRVLDTNSNRAKYGAGVTFVKTPPFESSLPIKYYKA